MLRVRFIRVQARAFGLYERFVAEFRLDLNFGNFQKQVLSGNRKF